MSRTWTKEKATKYKNEFIAQSYDRINLTVPKGQKTQMQEYAAEKGMSLNAFINKLIADEMGERLTRPTKEQGD